MAEPLPCPIVTPEELPAGSGEAYAAPWDHLRHELQRLDLRLAALARRNRAPADDPLDAFRGLAISDQVIEHTLDALCGSEAVTRDDATNDGSSESLRRIDAEIADRVAASIRRNIHLPLSHLRVLCRLSPFEEQCLVIALAPELDRRYEKLFGYLQDDVTQRRATTGLVMDLLCADRSQRIAARWFFDRQAPLRRFGLCRVGDGQDPAIPMLSRQLAVDDRIVDALLGRSRVDARLDDAIRLVLPSESHAPLADAGVERRILEFLQALTGKHDSAQQRTVFHVSGPRGTGKQSVVEAVCSRLGLLLLVVDLDRLPAATLPLEDAVRLVAREAMLLPAALCLRGFDALVADSAPPRPLTALLKALERCSRLTFLLARDMWSPERLPAQLTLVPVRMSSPDARAAARLWASALGEARDLGPDVSANDLASRFRLGPGGIRQGLAAARRLARWRSPQEGPVTMADVVAGCRSLTTPKLSALARKITPTQTWDDLVLPPDELAQLHELCDHARYRHVVLDEWGFHRKLPLGRGVSALFSGPPGTGKTMAAQVIAAELQLDLYQIDLSQVVSKYIGETEKNLRMAFDEADASQAILFFDEADALFGKRSDVKDAHDRYANIEIGYLLQRMEEYEGIAILATNLRQNLDDAFVRRLRFIVEFPFPDEEQRRRLWQVTLPREAPIAEDVDVGVLARQLKLAGGNIKNIGLAAAFSAAAAGTAIGMSQLLAAARREQQKLGRSWTEPTGLQASGSGAAPRSPR